LAIDALIATGGTLEVQSLAPDKIKFSLLAESGTHTGEAAGTVLMKDNSNRLWRSLRVRNEGPWSLTPSIDLVGDHHELVDAAIVNGGPVDKTWGKENAQNLPYAMPGRSVRLSCKKIGRC
jgi:hypothetical protein